MPYGISDSVWQYLDEQTKQSIIDSHQGTTTSPTPTQTQGEAVEAAGIYDPYAEVSGYNIPWEAIEQDPLLFTAFMFDTGAPPSAEYLSPEAQAAAQSSRDFLSYVGLGLDRYAPGAEQFTTSLAEGRFGFDPGGNYAWNVDQPFFQQFPESGGGAGGTISQIPSYGGPPVPSSATFSEIDLNVAGAPEWWRALAPDIWNPVSEYQTLANLMIPFLSPEDQRVVSSNLFASAPEQFALYNPEGLGLPPIPTEVSPELRSQFFTGERAQRSLDALDQLVSLTGRDPADFGPGYNYLRGLADTIQDFELTSGARQLTETQQGQLLSALDPQLAQTKSGPLSSFGPLARSFATPFFSAGALTGSVRNQFGDVIAGPRNPAFG